MPSELKELCRLRVLAKQAEDDAIAQRRKLDAEIAAALADPNKPEGTVSQAPEGFKVAVTYGITRKLDTKKLQADWDQIPAPVKLAVNWKADLSTTVFRTLGADDVAKLSDYMESKPSSPTVKVEVVS